MPGKKMADIIDRGLMRGAASAGPCRVQGFALSHCHPSTVYSTTNYPRVHHYCTSFVSDENAYHRSALLVGPTCRKYNYYWKLRSCLFGFQVLSDTTNTRSTYKPNASGSSSHE